VGDLYDFSGYPTGQNIDFVITPKPEFINIPTGFGKPALITAQVTPTTFTVKFTPSSRRRRDFGSLLMSNSSVVQAKRATNECTNPARKSVINQAYNDGKALAILAADYIQNRGASDQLFRDYYDSSPAAGVQENFRVSLLASITSHALYWHYLQTVASENGLTISQDCDDDLDQCSPGILSWTSLGGAGPNRIINYCPLFFTKSVPISSLCAPGGPVSPTNPNTTTVAAQNTRAGIALANSGRAIRGANDFTTGCIIAETLADRNPQESFVNPSTYECFATEVYKAIKCTGSQNSD
jgi:hypothetical protein